MLRLSPSVTPWMHGRVILPTGGVSDGDLGLGEILLLPGEFQAHPVYPQMDSAR